MKRKLVAPTIPEKRYAPFVMKLVETNENILWKVDFTYYKPDHRLYKPTVHILQDAIFESLLACKNMTVVELEQLKEETKQRGENEKLFSLKSNSNESLLLAYCPSTDTCYSIAEVQIWTVNEGREVTVIWPPKQLEGAELNRHLEDGKERRAYIKNVQHCYKDVRPDRINKMLKDALLTMETEKNLVNKENEELRKRVELLERQTEMLQKENEYLQLELTQEKEKVQTLEAIKMKAENVADSGWNHWETEKSAVCEANGNQEPDDAMEEEPALPDSPNQLIDMAWAKELNQEELVVNEFSIDIRRKDLWTLNGTNWLNDNIINYYLQLIVKRSTVNSNYPKVYAFNTFFYPNIAKNNYANVKRWTRKVDIFSYDVLLVPVHISNVHWCMAVIDMTCKRVEFYDSLCKGNKEVLPALKGYLASESMDKKKVPFDFSGWILEEMEDIPCQDNDYDCGVFSCQFAECAARRMAPAFSQEDIPLYRQQMVYEIVTNELPDII